jgi:hypothetical protein
MSAGGDFRAGLHDEAGGAVEAAREACRLTVIGEVVVGIWMEKVGERRRVEAREYEHKIR